MATNAMQTVTGKRILSDLGKTLNDSKPERQRDEIVTNITERFPTGDNGPVSKNRKHFTTFKNYSVPIGTLKQQKSRLSKRPQQQTHIHNSHAQLGLGKTSYAPTEENVIIQYLLQNASPKSGANQTKSLFMKLSLH